MQDNNLISQQLISNSKTAFIPGLPNELKLRLSPGNIEKITHFLQRLFRNIILYSAFNTQPVLIKHFYLVGGGGVNTRNYFLGVGKGESWPTCHMSLSCHHFFLIFLTLFRANPGDVHSGQGTPVLPIWVIYQ